MKKRLLILAIILVLFISACTQTSEPAHMPKKESGEKCGLAYNGEIWSGNISVICDVEVPEGVTLIIEPGTIIKFKYGRDYKNFDKAGLRVNGGTIKAIGTPEKQIWFTSAAPDPINGDWWGITLENTDNSEFDYVIVEFGEMGIEQFDSAVPIRNSIIRWSNAEGLYAERSEPIFENNLLYGNGYHEIALEQYNDAQIRNNIFRDGNYAIHHEKTKSIIEGNYFENYNGENIISAGMESNITIRNNKFRNNHLINYFAVYDGSVSVIKNNDFGDDSSPIPKLNFEDTKNIDLGYIPGGPEDRFLYIYDETDETRRTVKKIGEGLAFGWALVYANDYLWRFSLGDGEIGESLDFIKINLDTGEYKKYGNNEMMNPRGLAWDGEYFYVNDFSLLKIFKFQLDGEFIEIIDSFDIPEKELGGTSGLTSDGDYLYLSSRNKEKIYKLDKQGNLLDEIYFENHGVGGALVWTGEYFWTNGGCLKGICKWTKDGKFAGEIYPVAKDAWALAWDGEYLWSIQRTCEMWDDQKIYQIEILDDSLSEE